MDAKLIKTEVNYLLENEEGVIIVSTSLKKLGLALSLKNCQAIERGYDIEVLSNEYASQFEGNNETSDVDFMMGFLKALEIIGDKKFSEEDIIDCWETAHQAGRFEEKGIAETNWQTAINYAQSLKQTEWDVEIVMEDSKVVESHV
jgi:hypothetical protein